jgi:hypothetical protein
MLPNEKKIIYMHNIIKQAFNLKRSLPISSRPLTKELPKGTLSYGTATTHNNQLPSCQAVLGNPTKSNVLMHI